MTILIVDDNEQNLYQLQVLLGGNGCQVATATNGAEALAEARRNPPELIVSDILMPVMDGFTLCREWKKDERLRTIPFIFYTATYTDERDRAFALNLGAERFLVKPEEPEAIMQAIREVITQGRPPSAKPPDAEATYLKQYNETLIRKLEAKMQQLEQTNRDLVQNLAESKAHEREIERLTRLYATLSQINQAIIQVKSLDELLREICRVTADIGGFKVVWIGVCDPNTRQIRPVARGGVDDGYIDTIAVCADNQPEGCCPVDTCLREGKPCIVNDFLNSPQALPWRESARDHGIRAAVALPIRFKGEVWGAFTVYDGEADVFQDREVALLEEAASDISYAMDHLQQEAQYRTILQTAMDGFWKIDTQGRLLEVNSAYCRMSGYSEQELLSMRIPALEAEETADDTAAHIQKIMAQGEHRFEARHRRKDGSVIDVEVSAQYQPEDGGRHVAFLQDITERKRSEEYRAMGLNILHILNKPAATRDALSCVLKEVKTRTGFDAVGIRLQDGEDFPYFTQDGFPEDFLLKENALASRGADGGICRDKDGKVCLECTCGLVISGRTDPSHPLFTRGGSFWTNDSFTLLELPPELDPRHHPRNECIHRGYASVALMPVRDKERIVGLLHLNDRRKGCFTLATVELLEGIASHIGEALMRMRAEEALKESEERLELALRSSQMGVWLWDVAADKRSFDVQTCRLLGLSPTAFDGTSGAFFEAVHPEDRNKVRAAQAKTLAQDTPYSSEYRVVWPDGSIHHISARGQLVRSPAGQPQKILGVVWDVSERNRDEAELQKMQKLQSIGTLAGGIAHDFNNILLGLFGNISIAMDDLSKDHPSYAPLKDAEKSINRAVRLTKQLLTFAKGGDPVKESVSLDSMVEEVAHFDLTGSNVLLVCQPAEDLWPVDADRGQIQQVVSNLVINARQAMPTGGRLYITLENASMPEASVPGLRQGKYIKVTVRDEGTGIDPKVLDQIFDPYLTTKQSGNGLGLATVWSIINRHGGHISVISALGKGTTFTFYLPASESARPEEIRPAAAECQTQTRPAKILVMDDDEPVCTLAAKMLLRSGYSVVTAPGAQEAIALYKEAVKSGAPFDLVIMDLTIPGGPGGKEVIKDLLAFDPRVRAIVSSGYADDPVMANPSEYGFKGTVAKPYTASTLRDAVARVLA